MDKLPYEADDYRDLLFARQAFICIMLPTKTGLNNCLRSLVQGQTAVCVALANGKSRYKHLQTCKWIWGCPLCAERLARQARARLQRAVNAEKAAGYQIAFITYTVQHKMGESLAIVRDRVYRAHKWMHSNKAWQKLEDKYAWDGSVKATEPVYGENGWHYHVHELGFVAQTADLDELQSDLKLRWQAAVTRVGSWASDLHGLVLESANARVKDYIGKWGIVAELTGQTQKAMSDGGIQPFQFVDIALRDKQRAKWAEQMFMEYQSTMTGVKQLVSGGNLRPLMRFIRENPEDNPIMTNILLDLSREDWQRVVRRNERSLLLRAAENGDVDTIERILGHSIRLEGAI